MNADAPVQDARRIEVVCNVLPLWHGAQLAVDAPVNQLICANDTILVALHQEHAQP